MGQIFISHSSANGPDAKSVQQWLLQQGWSDVFLDLDPAQGLAPGQRWREELKKAGERCAAVIVLVSPAWQTRNGASPSFSLPPNSASKYFPCLWSLAGCRYSPSN